jgi:catechol 2,3-dioxygenase-like lactoylglutathione lyase family enzyme
MAIRGLNHITFVVRNLEASFDFYTNVLGCKPVARWKRGAYVRFGDVWIGLIVPPVAPAPLKRVVTSALSRLTIGQADMRVAFAVPGEDYGMICERIVDSGVTVRQHRQRTGVPALYFTDFDGHKLEMHIAEPYDPKIALDGNPELEFFI